MEEKKASFFLLFPPSSFPQMPGLIGVLSNPYVFESLKLHGYFDTLSFLLRGWMWSGPEGTIKASYFFSPDCDQVLSETDCPFIIMLLPQLGNAFVMSTVVILRIFG